MASIKPLDGGKHAGRAKRDLTPFQWHAASVVSAAQGPANMLESDDVIDVAASTADAVGILEYPGNMQGKPTHIIVAGRSKLKMTGTGSAGASVGIANGKGVAAADGDDAYCRALDNWADGDICPVYIDKHTAGTASPFTPPAEAGGGASFDGELITFISPVFSLAAYQGRTFVYDLTAPSSVAVNVFSGTGGDFIVSVSDGETTQAAQFSENANAEHLNIPSMRAGQVVITVTALAASISNVRVSPMSYPL